MSFPAGFPQIAVGWAGYRDPEPDEHSEALGEFPRMPDMPDAEFDAAAGRIHSREFDWGPDVGREIVLWRAPSFLGRLRQWLFWLLPDVVATRLSLSEAERRGTKSLADFKRERGL